MCYLVTIHQWTSDGCNWHYYIPVRLPWRILCGSCANLRVPNIPPIHLASQVFGDTKLINQKQAELLESRTRDQAQSALWHKERATRITASKFGDGCKKIAATAKFPDSDIDCSFLKTIYKASTFQSVATNYGIKNEIMRLHEYMTVSGNHVHKCGLVVNPSIPFLGASPDGLVCENGVAGLVEVKCPYSCKDLSVVEATNTLSKFFLELSPVTGKFMLKKDHNYYHQVQGQLLITGLSFCDFVTYCGKSINIEHIFPDLEFMQSMYTSLFQFHYGYGIMYLHL